MVDVIRDIGRLPGVDRRLRRAIDRLIDGVDEQIEDAVSTLLVSVGGITWTYDDDAGTLTPAVDHGSVGGLTDDDHTQYVLATGARDITGEQSIKYAAAKTGADDPVTLNLHSTSNGLWDSGQEVAVINFHSDDGSGAGAGVRSKIAMKAFNDGAAYSLHFSVDVGAGGLTEVFRFDKDLRMQIAPSTDTGAGKFNLFTTNVGQPGILIDMISGHNNNIITILDSGEIFVIDNDACIEAGVGAVSKPAYTFNDDQDTGLYQSAANVLGVAAGGELIAEMREGQIALSAKNYEPGDGKVMTLGFMFYLDETANELKVKAKYTDDTVKTGTVASLT